jgi:multiple sugar transport system ATP-binding protein
MAAVELTGLVKRYGQVKAVQGIDLAIDDGEFVVLVGPSGCGKSTTLRMIAGLEDVTEGTITIDGAVVNELDPRQRNIAMVFQNYAIYPHLTVGQNIGFGLYTSKLPQLEKQARIAATAKTLGLEDLLQRRPAELSGGQRQRVAIGRAMVRDPVAFLFDEPLSNLDAQLRAQMRIEIKRLHQRLRTTTVYVTHDQVEAMTMADRIVVMHGGRIMQVGTPSELYQHPANVFTARFIGTPSMNLLGATRDGAVITLGHTSAELHLDRTPSSGPQVLVGVRPHDLVVEASSGQTALTVSGTVNAVEPLGAETLVHIDWAGTEIIATASGTEIPAVDSLVTATAAPGSIHLFDASTEAAIGRA